MSIGFWQIAIVVILVVLLFGRGKISSLMGDVAKGIKSFKKGMASDAIEDNQSKDVSEENKDPKEVIIDEFIGQSIPIYLYEISHGTQKTSDEAIIFYGICFVLFRIFDILKPFPVNYFDKNYKNSFGVIMDDVCAGLYVVLSLICFMLLSLSLIHISEPTRPY